MKSFGALIRDSKPVLVDFFAEWCGPCKMMAPVLKEAKAALGDAVTIVKVDIDKNPETARQFDIQGVPTLILFRDGRPLWRQSGVVPARTLVQAVQQFAAG
ncbi:MAG TPA: thioredoxin [Chitinophagaceae bacterium]|jgi:thioredoxin 1|nr:thioredoxin [Chitinophagaceae bacterium]